MERPMREIDVHQLADDARFNRFHGWLLLGDYHLRWVRFGSTCRRS